MGLEALITRFEETFKLQDALEQLSPEQRAHFEAEGFPREERIRYVRLEPFFKTFSYSDTRSPSAGLTGGSWMETLRYAVALKKKDVLGFPGAEEGEHCLRMLYAKEEIFDLAKTYDAVREKIAQDVGIGCLSDFGKSYAQSRDDHARFLKAQLKPEYRPLMEQILEKVKAVGAKMDEYEITAEDKSLFREW